VSADPVPAGEAETRAARRGHARRLSLVIALTGVMLVVELVGAYLSRSLALLSDAGHLLTDLMALVLSLMAIRFAALPATRRKTYGYHRLEILTALANGTVLLLLSGGILYKSAQRVLEPVPVQATVMSAVALAGLLVNLAGVAILARCRGNLNVRGALMHVAGDALSSFGVLAAGVGIAFTGWLVLDPIVAGLIAVVIVVSAVRLVREAVDVLLEATPRGIDLEEVSRAIRAVPGVLEVHDLHVWSITTGLTALSGHVRVDGAGAAASDDMLNRIKRGVRDRFGIVHTTIQVESARYQELGDVH
jgi:cobalt-zinc-cadmium efflux system protein